MHKIVLDKWIEYAKGMILGFSIIKNTENIDVCVKTSFYMRHKILDCITLFMVIGDLDGVVEVDECFMPLSYKGNHKKSGFVIPCLACKIGKEVKKHAISNEQISISSAIEKNGNIIL